MHHDRYDTIDTRITKVQVKSFAKVRMYCECLKTLLKALI